MAGDSIFASPPVTATWRPDAPASAVPMFATTPTNEPCRTPPSGSGSDACARSMRRTTRSGPAGRVTELRSELSSSRVSTTRHGFRCAGFAIAQLSASTSILIAPWDSGGSRAKPLMVVCAPGLSGAVVAGTDVA